MNPRQALGRFISTKRLAQKRSRKRLGVLAGMSPRIIAEIESGERCASIEHLHRLASALSVKLAELARIYEKSARAELLFRKSKTGSRL
jgi:transcriptional regulator with XRE-family HTH domain